MSDPLNPLGPADPVVPTGTLDPSLPLDPVPPLDPVLLPLAAPVEVVDLIAAAVRACPAVAALHGGRFGQATTYLPGRRVAGVTVSPTEVVVGVVGRYPATVTEIADQVRAAVGLSVPGVAVTVTIEDLALPGEPVQIGGGADVTSPALPPPPSPPPVPAAGPVLPNPAPGARAGIDPVPARPPLATPLAAPEKELPR